MKRRKKQSGKLKRVYRRLGEQMDSAAMRKRADRVERCAEFITAKMCEACGKITRMRSTWCDDRFCPMCSERKSRAIAAQAMQVVPRLEGAPLLLTLTVRNVPGDQLDATIDGVQAAWRRMRKLKDTERGMLSWARTLEITYNEQRDDYHPHIHVIVYAADERMNKASFWGEIWRDAVKADYDPIIDVRPIEGAGGAIAGAVAEVSKYVTKVGKVLDLPDAIAEQVVWTLANALHRRRLRAYGGEWARIRREMKMADENAMTDDQVDALVDQVEGIVCCDHDMVDIIMRWTGLEYEITRENDGSPVVVPEPEAVALR
jgi:plasmid rolling circle replication initiator protein Rep